MKSKLPLLDAFFLIMICATMLLLLTPIGSAFLALRHDRKALVITLNKPFSPWYYELASAENRTLSSIAIKSEPYTMLLLNIPLPPSLSEREGRRYTNVVLKPVYKVKGYYDVLRAALNNEELQHYLVEAKDKLCIKRYYFPLLVVDGIELQRGTIRINIYGVSSNSTPYCIALEGRYRNGSFTLESITTWRMLTWEVVDERILTR